MDIDQLRKYCISLPAVAEEIKWQNDLVFTIGQKMFCIAALEPPFRFSFKVDDESFEEISNWDGFTPAPYLARAKWVSVVQPSCLTKDKFQEMISASYELIKAKLTKKAKQELGI